MTSPHSLSDNNVRLQWLGGRTELVNLTSIGKSGGAGEIFAIDNHPHHLAKIYYAATSPEQLAQYENKIRWMMRNPPDLPEIPAQYNNIVQLAWPVAQVMRQNRFVGFVMEKIDFERTLEVDYLLTRRQAEKKGFQVDFGKLVTLCYNLASLINCLHAKQIAVVDLKPINLKFYKSELYVSILDCDGFQIYAHDFRSDAPQMTPEYLAPEFHGQIVNQPESQDWFALATIIFRLLNYGIHPFSGIAVKREAYPSELAERIKLCLYPYGMKPHEIMRATPASVHDSFPDHIRALFDRAFSGQSSDRPSAYEWTVALGAYASKNAGNMLPCDSGHLQFLGKPCPTCVRDAILQGHVARQKRFLTRVQTSPTRALNYVRKTIQGKHHSPFQAALAQATFNFVQLNPVRITTRNAISLEILWIMGLVITYWWVK